MGMQGFDSALDYFLALPRLSVGVLPMCVVPLHCGVICVCGLLRALSPTSPTFYVALLNASHGVRGGLRLRHKHPVSFGRLLEPALDRSVHEHDSNAACHMGRS
jgi:hypothetical protein